MLCACRRLRRSQKCSSCPYFPASNRFGIEAALDHLRRAPLARDHRVLREMPPEVVGQVLRPAIGFPRPDDVERIAVQHEDSARPVTVRVAERADVDGVRAAVHRVGPRVAGARDDLFGLDDAHDSRMRRIGFRVDDVDARRTQAGHDQVAALDVRARRERTQRRAARVPSEVVELVAGIRQLDATELTARSSPRTDRRPRRRARPAIRFPKR